MAKLEINTELKQTKQLQVVEALSNAIRTQIYAVGETLPSVNELSIELQVSRDTVFKAYKELIKRNLVSSAPTKGYYVNNPINKAFLLLDSYSPYKDILYNAIVENLPPHVSVDLAFHHYNNRVFETLLIDSIGKYNSYIVMNINPGPMADVLKRLDANKLLMLDWGEYQNCNYSYVCQNFDIQPYNCLKQLKATIHNYSSFNLLFPEVAEHPKVTHIMFNKFCTEEKLKHCTKTTLIEADVKVGQAWFVLRQKDLIQLLKFCKNKGLIPGKDIGIISYNDAPLFEVIETGITAISTNFALMGHEAATFITTFNKIKLEIPTTVIKRGSL